MSMTADTAMPSSAFDFFLGQRKSWAQSHPSIHPRVTLFVRAGDLASSVENVVSMTAQQARAMAVALEAAATHAENALPSGLGESEAA